jgi:DNA-3-methyladenine glycosylase I
MQRCAWPRTELDIAYHDREWGVPEHDDRALFELLTLEGAQAGLSWSTILGKRESYREAFANFDASRVARFTPAHVAKLMANAGIVRNRLKIESTISNARAVLRLVDEDGSLNHFLWRFVDDTPQQNARQAHGKIPATTPESDALSSALKKRGFRFVGSTICYAFMQATGMVNDHTVDCFRYRELSGDPAGAPRKKASAGVIGHEGTGRREEKPRS